MVEAGTDGFRTGWQPAYTKVVWLLCDAITPTLLGQPW